MMPIDVYRIAAATWCEYACNGDDGRMVDDAVYRAVTEGRDLGPGYSSCADLAHWLLYRLGVRADWINRGEHNGWKVSVNVARLCREPIGTNPVARTPETGERFATGDVIIAWSRPDTRDAHVMIVDEHGDSSLRTWDYGQGPLKSTAWAGHRRHLEASRRERGLKIRDGKWVFPFGRRVESVLPLADVLAWAEQEGCLSDGDTLP